MINPEETAQIPDFKDMKTGLVIFGIIQIIFGAFCVLMIPFLIVGMLASILSSDSSAAPMSVRMMIPGVLFYIILAAWFIWMGIGSIKARRWARALILVTSWLWLICGAAGFIFVLLFMPNIYDQIGRNEQIPQAVVTIIEFAMIGFMTIFYVIIPLAFILFYGNKNVNATCISRDPQVRWTDKCPLPVLAVSLIFVFWALSMLSMGFYSCTIPFFGFILSGAAGAAVALVAMFLFVYMAWGTYKLKINAWWCSVLLVIAWALSSVITFSRVSMLDFCEKMDFPEQQLEIMKESCMPRSFTMALFFGLWFFGFLGYLLYTRKYFTPSPNQESDSQQTPY